ncbi:MAG: hypothetical protein OXN21_08500 [Chloroflexota bacterium]|nr:hypothetical protein [Chloroflexota bacterium]
MSNAKPFALLAIPDDEPPALAGTPLESRARELADLAEWHTTRPASNQETIERIRKADAIINIRSAVPFPREVLEACPNLKLLSVWGTGVDHVDLAAAEELGITVSNTPDTARPMCPNMPSPWPWPSPAR